MRNNKFFVYFSGSNMTDMQCMLQMDDTTLLIAGHQDEIFELDLNRHKIIKEVCHITLKLASLRLPFLENIHSSSQNFLFLTINHAY